MSTFVVTTERKTQLVDITAAVRDAIAGRAGTIAVVFVPHTTAGVLLQASGEGTTAVASDVESAFERLVDERAAWKHSHVVIPIVEGDLALGRLQHVFLAEFDGPRERTIRVEVAA